MMHARGHRQSDRHFLAAALVVACTTGVRAQCADPVPPSPRWVSSVEAQGDPFAVDGPGARWVKFLIRTCEPGTVLFQDGWTYPFHAQFATAEVPPFVGMTTAEFDAVSLHATGQQAILGAVLLPPYSSASSGEIGIQLVRRDPYASSEVVALFDTVRSRVTGATAAFYMPTYEQRAQAEADRAFLQANGVEIASPDRWAPGNTIYAKGWALGRLQHVPTADIETAWLAGQLLPTDILLTEAVPAEVPPVAGIAAFEPATPSSHVAILAGTWGIPFVHLARAADRDRALSFVGQRIVLRASDERGVKLIQVEGRVDETSIAELLALKAPQPLAYQPLEALGAYSANAAGLTFADANHFGGKASSFGLLRRTIPANSPVAAAFSFDLWTGFLDQTLAGGRTLREEIRLRLAPYSWPPDMAALSSALAGIRQLFTDTAVTSFSPAQQAAILATLQDPQYGFDPLLNLRFRSSTNMEDAAQFTGAGLYDSYSGCLADDQDADTSGPSLCDATEASERGVYRAIRKVFASFYNDNAYLERLRHAVDEDQVGMALLVHHSFPDAFEMANGVATLRARSAADRQVTLVTQAGAVSVTNPTDGSLPEVVSTFYFGGVPYHSLQQESNLVQLGARVMEWPADYDELAQLLAAVSSGYATETGEQDHFLDFEYKKLAPDGRLEIKQVRRLPLPSAALTTPFLINEPVSLSVEQGEQGLALGLHRAKSNLQLETASTWLTDTVLRQGFLAQARHEYTDGCTVLAQEGLFSTWPGASHSYDAAAATTLDTWTCSTLGNPRTNTLTIASVPSLVPEDDPIRVLSDFGQGVPRMTLVLDHASPVTYFDGASWTTTTTDWSQLSPPLGPGSLAQLREVRDPAAGIAILTSFTWPLSPTGPIAGYTAPLACFESTTITGLTTDPLVLTSPWSQTYRPAHHNFSEELVFDPWLDPGVTQAQLDELAVRGVRGIYALDVDAAWGDADGEIRLLTDELWSNTCVPCPGGDLDGDGHCATGPAPDCDDGNGAIWATPTEATGLRVTRAGRLTWRAPWNPGSASVAYDTLRSGSPSDFASAGACLETDGSDLSTIDASTPGPGAAYFYLVRAANACPAGSGELGRDSLGRPRVAPDCP